MPLIACLPKLLQRRQVNRCGSQVVSSVTFSIMVLLIKSELPDQKAQRRPVACRHIDITYLPISIDIIGITSKTKGERAIPAQLPDEAMLSWRGVLPWFLPYRDQGHSNPRDKLPRIEVLHESPNIRYTFLKRCNRIHWIPVFAQSWHQH